MILEEDQNIWGFKYVGYYQLRVFMPYCNFIFNEYALAEIEDYGHSQYPTLLHYIVPSFFNYS